MSLSLIYIHIGKTLPIYIYDSIYQTLLINSNLKIFILIDDLLLESFQLQLDKFNININLVFCVPLSILQNSTNVMKYSEYVKKLPKESSIITFRDNFWISTTSRFFYIEEFIRLFSLKNVFHIENDVMLYEDLNFILKNVCVNKKLYMVQDSIKNVRVVPSIIFIPNIDSINELNKFMITKLNENLESFNFLNDMNLLGMYKNKEKFPFDFNQNDSNYIFDGAAIGQYLGGFDPNNLPKEKNNLLEKLKNIKNPSKGFINETCDFKINKNISFFRKPVILKNIKTPIDLIYGTGASNSNNVKLKQVVNLHIHSKQLCQFSSVFDVKYDNIITGDRVLNLVDFIISTPQIYDYHKNMSSIINNKIITVIDFKKVNTDAINNYFNEFILNKTDHRKYIKLFIYTHILDDFINYIYSKLSKNYMYIIYLHNSDHTFGENDLQRNFILDKNIKHIYSQNVNILNEKVSLLPIGLANSMFKHGDLVSLYTIMSDIYKFKKEPTANVYININPNTFYYRKFILDEFKLQNIKMITTPKPFIDYLEELSQYKFCLCLRGNGIDTHRFWEAISMNVIPIIINNKHTNMQGFVSNLKKLGVPFYEINDDDIILSLNKYFKTDFFNERLYNKIKDSCNVYNLQCLNQLKIEYYS